MPAHANRPRDLRIIHDGQEGAVEKAALLSPCGLYRYTLHREWGRSPDAGQVLWIMLNPSTADAQQDDPTIRRCIAFARRFGCGGITVVNLFAFRSTNPAALLSATDPVGPDNDAHIRQWVRAHARRQDYIIAAWGARGNYAPLKERRDAVLRLLPVSEVLCLGTTENGNPVHPLYVPGERTPNEYDFPRSAWAKPGESKQ